MKKLQKWMLATALFCSAFAAQAQNNVKYHTVEEGQTLYAIARLYGVPASEILALNPNAGDLIKPGDKIRIPATATPQQGVANGPGAQFVGTAQVPQAVTTQPNGKANCKEMYEVKKKDNLYRIALNYHLTVEEIIAANPTLKADSKLKKGAFLCIPYSKAEIQAEQDRVAAARAAAEAEARKNHRSHLNVAIILPFKDQDRGAKMVEFYQGMLMAVDSVRKQGTSVDVYAYHSGNSLSEINAIMGKDEMKRMDLVFGPLDGVQANVISNFCQQHKIRMVMPFATTSTYAGTNPYAYVVSTTPESINHNGAALAAMHFTNHHYVVINAGAADARGSSFVQQMSQQLSARGISARQLDLDADDMAFTSTLNQFRDNLVILNNSSSATLQKALRKLRAFQQQHPEYKISLLGYPEWSTYQGSIRQDFHALDTYLYTSFYRNPNDARLTAYETRFKANFHTDLIKTSPRYGMMGMDLGYYFMHGMAQLGDNFDVRQGTLRYSPLQTAMRFSTSEAGKAHQNNYVSLVHYTTAGKLEIVEQK